MKGIAEGTYKNKHAEAAKLYIYTITYTCTYAHIHTGTWRGLAKIVVETEVVIEEQILHIKQAGMGAKQTRQYTSIEGIEYNFFPRKWNIGTTAFSRLFLNKIQP